MDMISQLSDELIIRIMSRLWTKHVMATCCFSKRWLLLRSLVPKLYYDDCGFRDENYANFTQFVYRSLMSNKAPVLETLYLSLGPKSQAIDVGNWIETAVVCHHVQVISVNIHSSDEKGTMISLPSSMYTSQTLETLDLNNRLRLDVPFSVRLPSLKNLKLADVDYADNKVSSLTRILSGCPNLDSLLLVHDNLDVALMVPSLRRLRMYNKGRYQKGGGFVIDAPSLVFLYIRDYVLYDFHRIEHMPNLEHAHVEITCAVRNHKFLKAFTCARSLTLCLSFLEVLSPGGMIFYNLVDLKLNTCAQGWWDLVTRMLEDSPNLRFLKLHDERLLHEFTSIETPDSWKRPSSVPKCLLHSFETFEWEGYKGRRGDVDMATYIITNATRLKKSNFWSQPHDDSEGGRIHRDLNSLHAASPHLMFLRAGPRRIRRHDP